MKKKFLIILGLLLALIISCQYKNNDSTEEISSDTVINTSSDNTTQKFVFTKPEPISVSDIPKDIKYTGNIYYARRWTDKNGENIFILSKKETRKKKNGSYYESLYLYGYHYVKTGETYTLKRKIMDFEEDCEFDLNNNLYKDLIDIADRDRDNFAEITILYTLYCSSDVGPIPLKLLMLENGEKYAIRGYIPVYLGEEAIISGEKNIDPSFNKASKVLLYYANYLWDSLVTAKFEENKRLFENTKEN